MKKIKNHNYKLHGVVFCLLALTWCQLSCKDYLDVKPDKELVVPSTLADVQALLNNNLIYNQQWPSIGEVASDNMYLDYQTWAGLSQEASKNGYIWQDDIVGTSTGGDWAYQYTKIFYSNTILETLDKMEVIPDQTGWNAARASALFYRAFTYFSLAQHFCKPYQENPEQEPGLPLRLSSDLNDKVGRASVAQTYAQILRDAEEAVSNLPVTVQYKTQPNKAAGYALLARINLAMGRYLEAGKNAGAALQLQNTLIDYNTLNATKSNPFSRFNDEIIFHCTLLGWTVLFAPTGKIDEGFYQTYASNDLRKTLYFKSAGTNHAFYGSYDGSNVQFAGFATDEMYLIRAECYARANDPDKAMEDLNRLLVKRWKTNTFVPLQAGSPDEALAFVLQERRKTLVFRGLRWSDLRRLNKDQRFAVTISRNLNGQLHQLDPNDPRYVFAIPESVIAASGIQQNIRK